MRNELLVIRSRFAWLIKTLAEPSVQTCEVNKGNEVFPSVLIFRNNQQSVVIVSWFDHNSDYLALN